VFLSVLCGCGSVDLQEIRDHFLVPSEMPPVPPEVFRESGHSESRVVDQNVQAAVVADDIFDEAGQRVEMPDIERVNIR
jgi:hypothetical protein